jgi:hypothetical protein
MTTRSSTQPYFDALTDAGYRILSTRRNRHFVVRCLSPTGKEASFVFAMSASDHRALANFRTSVRRHLREDHAP